eukprot:GFUD01007237.1.p1 GENE.GFUD01007237.1~~GFUD01007237.1.p1  ORF type:complete len:166 (+),score=34.25 GFUD01007237.1:141-638(+)
MRHRIGVAVVMQALVMITAGGFIVGKERVDECSGSVTIIQSGRQHLKILSSTPILKLSKKQPVLVRVEGNCCWTVHSRKKFKGFKTFVRSQGELKLSRKLIRSIASTDCSNLPQLYIAGGGWMVVGVVVLVALLLSAVFLSLKRKKTVKNYESDLSGETDQLAGT